MRPATRPGIPSERRGPLPAIVGLLPWIVAVVALVLLGHAARARVVGDRCIAAARAISMTGGKTVGAELERIAPGGSWSIGALGPDESRAVVYTAGERFEWSCRDEAMRPSFVAVSPRARELTPELYFP